jgi:hypothetical protein
MDLCNGKTLRQETGSISAGLPAILTKEFTALLPPRQIHDDGLLPDLILSPFMMNSHHLMILTFVS